MNGTNNGDINRDVHDTSSDDNECVPVCAW